MSETRLGRYKMIAPIGEGGMGTVWRAHDEQLRRDLAIKILSGDRSDPASAARLVREARIAATLNHPNICTIYEVGEADGRAFIAMELVPGVPLSEHIPPGGLPPERVAELGGQVADAIAHAHAHGVIHRDLKSENVIVTPEPRAKVLDFGIARFLGGLADGGGPTTSSTESAAVAGTPYAMAPEVLRGQQADERSDQWSLGVLLYQAASGDRPFKGRTTFEIAHSVLHDPPGPLPARVPPPLARIITRCLERKPEARFESVAAVKAALDRLRAGGPELPRPRSGWSLAIAALFGVALLAVTITRWSATFSGVQCGAPRGPEIRSLAVLPLANLSGNPAEDYFADGMTEALITELAPIPALKVISRTSVMRYKGTQKALPDIARELGVDGIVEGSVMREGGRVRITAQLIDAPRDRHLWARSYDREMANVLDLQRDVALDIARNIQLELSESQRARLAAPRTVNPRAYELYLKGRVAWSRSTDAGVREAIGTFGEALREDPADARSYSGLADAYVILAQVVGSMTFREALPRVKENAERALAIDSTLAEANTSMGMALMWGDYDCAGAERRLRHALELNPNYVPAHLALAGLLSALGRTGEAIDEGRRSVELDPLSPIAHYVLGWTLISERRFGEAEREARGMLEVAPGFMPAWTVLTGALERAGRFDAAIEAHEMRVRAGLQSPGYPAALREGYRREGPRGYWKVQLDSALVGQHSRRPVHSGIAVIYAQLGRADSAFAELDRAYEAREGDLLFVRQDALYDGIRGDPRFQAFLRRMGLAP